MPVQDEKADGDGVSALRRPGFAGACVTMAKEQVGRPEAIRLLCAKIISGGQTGADRAGLEAARELGLMTGGWAPSGYRTERGTDISLIDFGLRPGGSLIERTWLNVRDSNATVIFAVRSSPGSDLTVKACRYWRKPYCVINPFLPDAAAKLRSFLKKVRPMTLNVAGHRESVAPGIGEAVRAVLLRVLDWEKK